MNHEQRLSESNHAVERALAHARKTGTLPSDDVVGWQTLDDHVRACAACRARVRTQKGSRLAKLSRAILCPIGLDHRNRWLLTVDRDPKCLTHPEQRLVIFCPACRGAAGGQSVSRKKIKAVKANLQRATRARDQATRARERRTP